MLSSSLQRRIDFYRVNLEDAELITGDLPSVVDLFCGAGGLSEGLCQAGLRPVVALDYDRHSVSTYRTNHPDVPVIHDDVANVSGRQILDISGQKSIDLVVGGPSCQGFSTHGKRIQDDPRNFLFVHFVRLVSELNPRMFLMENVRGLLTYGNGFFRHRIEEAFSEIGYKTEFRQLNAADFGVPQMRTRLFFIGTRDDSRFATFPVPSHGQSTQLSLIHNSLETVNPELIPYVTVNDAIGDLPFVSGGGSGSKQPYLHEPQNEYQQYCRSGAGELVNLHFGKGLSPQSERLASFIGQGQGIRAVPHEELPDRFKRMRTISSGALRKDCTTLYYRIHPDRPSYTITCNYKNIASGPFLHPHENRSLTHREAARLMSFPDRYEFVGACIPRQIGNAVPPLLARAIGKELLSAMTTEHYSAIAAD